MRYVLIGAFASLVLMPPALAQTPAPPPRPSFDCAKAKARVEQAICKSPALAALDVREAALLRRARAAVTMPDAVNAEEDEWRGARNDCRNDACIADAYRDRIEELRRWTN